MLLGTLKKNPSAALIVALAVMIGCASQTIKNEDLVKNNIPEGSYSVLVTIADNQVGIARGLDAAGAARYAGRQEEVTVEGLAETVRSLLADPAALKDMSEKARGIVDGLGSRRVADVLISGKRGEEA